MAQGSAGAGPMTAHALATPVGQRYLRSAMETTGAMVAMLARFGNVDLAAKYARQGLRAARLLGLYTQPPPEAGK